MVNEAAINMDSVLLISVLQDSPEGMDLRARLAGEGTLSKLPSNSNSSMRGSDCLRSRLTLFLRPAGAGLRGLLTRRLYNKHRTFKHCMQ